MDAEREEEMVSFARRFSVEHLRICCRHARAVADPEGFEKDSERDFERRWLEVSHLPARRGGRAAKRLGWGRAQA